MNDFVVGEKLYTVGLNMQCKPVITTVVYAGPDKKKPGQHLFVCRGLTLTMRVNPRDYFKSKKEAKASIK